MKTEKLTYLGLGPHHFDLKNPLLMGVANVTPDSFSDGGSFSNGAAAIARAVQLFESGADIIDVGGESTRPGAKPVPSHEERTRVIPVVRELVKMGIPTSVDTMKPEIMEEAADIGACLINDISGMKDEAVARMLSRKEVGVCVMHMRGTPQDMQDAPSYSDVVTNVCDFLKDRAKLLLDVGFNSRSIIVDPGFGFGKRLEHNLTLLRNLSMVCSLGFPVLVGLSRKFMLGEISGKKNAKDRLGSSIAAAIFAIHSGANIVRVHDVNETRDAIVAWAEFS